MPLAPAYLRVLAELMFYSLLGLALLLVASGLYHLVRAVRAWRAHERANRHLLAPPSERRSRRNGSL